MPDPSSKKVAVMLAVAGTPVALFEGYVSETLGAVVSEGGKTGCQLGVHSHVDTASGSQAGIVFVISVRLEPSTSMVKRSRSGRSSSGLGHSCIHSPLKTNLFPFGDHAALRSSTNVPSVVRSLCPLPSAFMM